jgi:hypothetical protein
MADDTPIPVADVEDEAPDDSLRRARPIPVAAVPAQPPAPTSPPIPVGSTEDLETRGLAQRARPIPVTATPATPEPGSTADLEAKSLETFEHPKSAPIQTGVASLWTKAQNIHNPVLRVLGEIGAGGARALDAIGTGVGRVIPAVGALESAIPGTTMNEALKERQESRQEANQAGLEKTQADTEEAKARAHALEQPVAKEPANPESEVLHDLMTGENGQPRMNPATQQPYTYLEAYQAAQQAKPTGTANEGKTIQTDKGIMQWNPQTQRYDIPAGAAPDKNTPTTKVTRIVNGVPHEVLVNSQTGEDVKDEGATKVPNDNANTNRADKSYQLQSTRLDKIRQPVEQIVARVGRLNDTLNQNKSTSRCTGCA